MLYVGIDASLKTLAVCAVSENGTTIAETTIANGREPLDSWLNCSAWAPTKRYGASQPRHDHCRPFCRRAKR